MLTNSTKKAFSEAMLRLKRDSINFSQNQLKLQLNETDFIGYNLITNNWTVSSSFLTNDNWDPKLSEVISFIENYQDHEILVSIESLNEKTEEIGKTIDALSLESKFINILNLLKFEENKDIPIYFDFKNEIIQILYNFDTISFEITTPYLEDSSLNDILRLFNFDVKESLDDFLSQLNYFNVLNSLNDCFSILKRQK